MFGSIFCVVFQYYKLSLVDFTDLISAAIETKRKELLPMMNQIDFVKLSMQDNDPSAYDGVLPADIYQQINQIIEDENEAERTAEEPVDN